MKKKSVNYLMQGLTILLTVSSLLAGCAGVQSSEVTVTEEAVVETQEVNTAADTSNVEQVEKTEIPKYIFLFIGDGMSYPQIQSASYYLGATGSDSGVDAKELSFMDFPVVGSAQTFDKTSFCPDSASTATSISTGNKTYSGTINMDTTMTEKFETISEKLKKQLGYKIGILSTVNLNHATPAAFYAHQESRNSYYDIGLEMISSNFDYFAGGGLKQVTGEEENQEDLYQLAQEAGYTVVKTQQEVDAVTNADSKVIIIDEKLADSDSMAYEMDTDEAQLQLSDYVEKGIEYLDNDTGFFMMIEGGKIDWACHANDAAASIHDTIALDESVKAAIEFYEKHPEDTLIILTGDHETGGLSIGYAGTNYDTYLTNLENQKISFAKFDTDYVEGYVENKTSFENVLKDVKANFGLMTAEDSDAATNPNLVLTDYEYELLKTAYDRTLETGASDQEEMSQEEYVLYGTYEPLSVTITHILNNKSGISFTSYSHTGIPVPVFALGNGQNQFEGYYDNTDIFNALKTLTGVK